jgi:hypothetical protein
MLIGGEIKKIFVQMRESYLWLFYDNSDEAIDVKISENYTLGYVPDGYNLVGEFQAGTVGKYQWINENGDYLVFEQTIWDGTQYSIDSEVGETTTILSGNREVYYRKTQLHTYIWNDGTYSFVLSSSQPVSTNELELILEGMEVVQ